MDKLRKIGPLPGNHPAIGKPCPACGDLFLEGDYVTIVCLGPGRDKKAQELCREDRPYNAVGLEIHWDCATGEES